MNLKKKTGSFYTPEYLSDFIVNYIFNNNYQKKKIEILEPSSGDGIFLKSLVKKNKYIKEIILIEKKEKELLKSKEFINRNKNISINCKFIASDFLVIQSKLKNCYDLIIGNPPYIKKSFLSKKQIKLAAEILNNSNISNKSFKNIWSSFFIKCSQLLNESGILVFILPAEFLQVKFTENLRTYSQEVFQKIEIITFNDLLFECKGQDTILFIGYKKSDEKGLFYFNSKSKNDLNYKNINFVKNTSLINSNLKWSNYFLSDNEVDFLQNLRSKLGVVKNYCNVSPGIVTAANKFFVINKSTEEKNNLNGYGLPILQKSIFVNGSVIFSKADYKNLINSRLPSRLLNFKDVPFEQFNDNTKKYLEFGKLQKIDKRYKCLIRKNWYTIPNISKPPQGFIFKRSHLYPKILKNSANIYITDSAYKINMKLKYNINSLIYSFYNSLSLIYTEILGRFYGGGVLELTPSEFNNIPLPYYSINNKEFLEFNKTFTDKKSINHVLEINDKVILKDILKLNNSELEYLRIIKDKLTNRRLRINT